MSTPVAPARPVDDPPRPELAAASSISPQVMEAIAAHARQAYPDECCGYIVGRGARARVVACTNRQDQLHAMDPLTYPRTAREGYQIGGRELLALVRSFDSDAPATILYHSHPDVGAYFSDEDVRAAIAAGYPVDYLVVDVTAEHVHGARVFRRETEGDAFVEIERHGSPRALPLEGPAAGREGGADAG